MSKWILYDGGDNHEIDSNFAILDLDNQVAWSDVYTFAPTGCVAMPGRVSLRVFDEATKGLMTIGSSTYRNIEPTNTVGTGFGFLAADATQEYGGASACNQPTGNYLTWPANMKFDVTLNLDWPAVIARLGTRARRWIATRIVVRGSVGPPSPTTAAVSGTYADALVGPDAFYKRLTHAPLAWLHGRISPTWSAGTRRLSRHVWPRCIAAARCACARRRTRTRRCYTGLPTSIPRSPRRDARSDRSCRCACSAGSTRSCRARTAGSFASCCTRAARSTSCCASSSCCIGSRCARCRE